MKRLLCLILTILSASFLTAAEVALIKGGSAKSVIVVEDANNVTAKKAAEEMQSILLKRTGVKLQILSAKDPVPAGMIPVYLGLSERTAKLGADSKKIKYDGYFFKATPEYVVIAGRDKPQMTERYYGHTFVYCNYEKHYYAYGERGTGNGVYKMLEQYAGVRHYMPHELGHVIPQSKDFVLPVKEYTDAPAFRERHWHAARFKEASQELLDWYYRMCSGGQNNSINHSYNRMTRFKDTNPEYFALIGGKRDFTNLSTANNYGNLCLTNPEGIKAFAKLAQDFFNKNPDYTTFAIVPQDGLFKICECENCKKLYSPHLGVNGRFSNAVFHHAAEIAKIVGKTHPDKLIGTLAYAGYRVVPEIDLPPNMAVRICYTRQSLRNPAAKKEVEDAIKGYAKKKVPILVWTYPLFNHIPPLRGIPVFYPHILQENIKFNRDHGVIGEFSEGGYYSGGGDQHVKRSQIGFPAITHLNDYVRFQLLWNPDLDLNALLDEYYTLFYGPAAPEMKNFWNTAEKIFLKNGEATMYTTEDLDLFTKLLKDAARKAPAGTVYAKRIKLLQDELAPFFKTMYMLRSKGKFMGVSLTDQEIPMEYSIDSVWKHAREYLLTMKDGRTVTAKPNRTHLYAIANQKGLGLHVICKEPNMPKLVDLTKKRDDGDNAWKDDCLELFLITADRRENRHYIITVGGQIVDGRRTIDVNTSDWDWNSDLKLRQFRGKDYHTYTIFIPWSDLGMKFEDLPQLMFQMFRRQTHGNPQTGTYYVLFPSLGYHNYSPEYFGRIEFLGKENRILNGGFETINAKGNPVGWTTPAPVCKGGADEGIYYMLMAGRKGGKDKMMTSDLIPVEADRDYSISLRHQGDSGYIYVLFYDKNNKRVPDPARTFFWTDTKKNWKTCVFQGRVPANAVACRIGLRNFDGSKYGGAFFDKLEFIGGVQYLKPNPNFKNGSFEQLGNDGKPAFWGRPCNLETTGAADGKNCIRVVAKGGDSLYSNKFAIKGGSKFQLNFKMKGSTGYVYFIYYDANGKKTGDAKYYGFQGKENWSKYTINGVFPKNAASCSIMVRNYSPGKSNGVYFDAMELLSE